MFNIDKSGGPGEFELCCVIIRRNTNTEIDYATWGVGRRILGGSGGLRRSVNGTRAREFRPTIRLTGSTRKSYTLQVDLNIPRTADLATYRCVIFARTPDADPTRLVNILDANCMEFEVRI